MKRVNVKMSQYAPVGTPLLDLRGHQVGQVISCSPVGDGPIATEWILEGDVEDDAVTTELQPLPYSISGSLN
jgi:hypothetical protein